MSRTMCRSVQEAPFERLRWIACAALAVALQAPVPIATGQTPAPAPTPSPALASSPGCAGGAADGCQACGRPAFRLQPLSRAEVGCPWCAGRGCRTCGPVSNGTPPIELPAGGIAAAPLGRDEYLCDGGDRALRVVVGRDWRVHGLDAEDTVGHFDTLDGRRLVEPSNRVCVYAPRFAAVRKLSGAVAADVIDAAVQTAQPLPHFEVSRDQRSSTTLQNLAPHRAAGTQGVAAFRDQTRALTADNTLIPSSFAGIWAAHEDFQVLRTGQMDNAEKARLAIMIDAARSWEGRLAVQVASGGQKPLIVRDALVAQEETVYGHEQRPRLRLYKVASAAHARPGETIDFTIRFDNIGNQEIGNVTILDHLTTRLEYVEGSAECSVEHVLKVEANESDSATLRWEIAPPLKSGEGGVIRFRCRVR